MCRCDLCMATLLLLSCISQVHTLRIVVWYIYLVAIVFLFARQKAGISLHDHDNRISNASPGRYCVVCPVKGWYTLLTLSRWQDFKCESGYQTNILVTTILLSNIQFTNVLIGERKLLCPAKCWHGTIAASGFISLKTSKLYCESAILTQIIINKCFKAIICFLSSNFKW